MKVKLKNGSVIDVADITAGQLVADGAEFVADDPAKAPAKKAPVEEADAK